MTSHDFTGENYVQDTATHHHTQRNTVLTSVMKSLSKLLLIELVKINLSKC